jgi:beta-1,4-N-acetylglucosaminyltransferase
LPRRKKGRGEAHVELLLVCSSGGHLLQLDALRRAWSGRSTLWVTFDKSDARSLLADDPVTYAYGPTNRNIPNLLRNSLLAVRLIRRVRPLVVLTTGAGIAVPFAWVGRAFGARVVYVESITRIEDVSLTYRLVAPIANEIYVQWPELAEEHPEARYAGSVFSFRR